MDGSHDRWVISAAALALAIAAAAPACRFEPVSGVLPADPDAAVVDAAVDAIVIGDASNDWWDPAWNHRRQITIKNDELTGPVQNFPLLVRLPAGVGRPGGPGGPGGSGGEDLRFVATDQTTVLPHERDTGGEGGTLVWVRIPEISNTGPAPTLWVYYDNETATSTSSGPEVFGNLYVSVHHLGQGAGPNLPDATGHNHTASASPMSVPALTTDGQIGGARDFDGQNDYLELAGEAAYDFTASLSVSAWIRVENLNLEYQAIVTKGDKTWRIHRHDQTSFIGFGTTLNNNNDNQLGDVDIANGNGWHHVAIVFGASTKRIFVDGQLDQENTVAPTIDTSDVAVSLGRNTESTTGGARFWNGDLDEVRISGAARDAHWMFAEHHTVVNGDFVQVGGEETTPL